MIPDFTKWRALLTYDGFKSQFNVTEGLKTFVEERIRVGKEEAGTSAFNQAYGKFKAKQDKTQTSQLLELEQWKVRVQINQWQLIVIISTAIQNIPDKFCTYSFVSVNLHPCHCMTFPDWIKNISLAIKTEETEYF